jgi:protein required for attachment to host cells
MQLPRIWIVVANQSSARFYRYAGDGKTPVLEASMDNPEGRAHVHDLVTDRPGRVFGSRGSRRTGGRSVFRHALPPSTDPHDHAAKEFARRVAERLKDERRKERFGALALVCEPRFLGMIRATLDRATEKCVVVTRDAGRVAERGAELAESLRGLITPAMEIQLA